MKQTSPKCKNEKNKNTDLNQYMSKEFISSQKDIFKETQMFQEPNSQLIKETSR